MLTNATRWRRWNIRLVEFYAKCADSSRLAQRLDPDAMHELMNRVLRLMAEAVHRYEGTVNQFLGDGLMALFGAPIALEDHALRASQAALAIQETVNGYSEQLKRERGVELQLRQGLHTGLVVVGTIGDDLRMDYTAVGDTTNLAARMQTTAEPGSILMTGATHRLVDGYVRSEPLGLVHVKGWSEPISVFKLTGRGRRRSRLEARADTGLTTLIGRERELNILQDRLARAEAGRGQVVSLVGEPGVGKSRLLYEFRRVLEQGRVTWLEGQCVAYGQATPYLPVLEILRTNFQIEDGDNPLQIEDKLRRGLRRVEVQAEPGLEHIMPFLGELFGLPGDEALRHLDPKDKRRKVFEAIRMLTAAGARRRPHVLVLEDLHWLDRTSEEYLVFFVESLPGIPVLLLTTHRPGYTVRWADKTYYTQIALDLLSEADVELMISRLLGTSQVQPDLVRVVWEKAEGNPLFVEEITTSLRERGFLVPSNGGFAWAPGAVVEVPGTVQDIIRARLDRLDEPVKRTVQTAAVIGREFGLNLLARVSEISHEVQSYLDTLKRLELVHETRFLPELEYTFKHAVIQDVAYQSLLAQRRKELHGAISRAIADLYPDRLEEQAAILAYHYARSDQQDKAVEYALLAGDRAARLYANAEARTYYEQALTIARALPVSPDAQRAQIDAALKLAAVGVTRQDFLSDEKNLPAVQTLAEQLDDQPRLARVLYWLGRIPYVLGDPRTAIRYAAKSLELAERLGDDGLAAPPINLLGRAYTMSSEFAKAAPSMERSVEQMRQLGNKAEESTAASFAGVVFAFMGLFESAFQYGDRGLRLAREIQNPFAEAAAHHLYGFSRCMRGEWRQAIRDCTEARRIAERAGDLFRVYMTKLWEGWAWTRAGDPSRARVMLEESLDLSTRIGTKFQLSFTKANLTAALMAMGTLDGVPGLCQEALRLAEETQDRLGTALAHRVFADAVCRGEPPDLAGAERALLEAIRIEQEIGARPELARTYLSHARLLKARGETAKAREVLAQAIDMFREMGIVWDLERAERELTASELPSSTG